MTPGRPEFHDCEGIEKRTEGLNNFKAHTSYNREGDHG